MVTNKDIVKILRDTYIASFLIGIGLSIITDYIDLSMLMQAVDRISSSASVLILLLFGAYFSVVRFYKIGLVSIEVVFVRIVSGFLAIIIIVGIFGGVLHEDHVRYLL